jgi:hypothetical protein
LILQQLNSFFLFLTSPLPCVSFTLSIMNRPRNIEQWDPSQPNREPRPGLSDASFAQSIACNAENSSPVIVGEEDLTNADHYAELPSIQAIIDEAIRSDDSATDSTDTPTSAGGASRKPILIPSDVDSDAEDSDDSDSSLPPAHKLIISVTQSRRRRISRTGKSRNRLPSRKS